MKIAVVLVACLGLALAAAVKASTTLSHDLEEFYNLLSEAHILDVVSYYLYNDDEVSELLNIVQTQDFYNGYVALYGLVATSPAFTQLQLLLKIHGVHLPNVALFVSHGERALRTSTPMATLSPPRAGTGTGYKGMIDEIKALIPTDKVNALWRYKMAFNPDFKEFAEKFESEDFITLAKDVQASPEYKTVVNYFEEKGVDVQEVILHVQKLFDLNESCGTGAIMQRSYYCKGLLIVLLAWLYIWST